MKFLYIYSIKSISLILSILNFTVSGILYYLTKSLLLFSFFFVGQIIILLLHVVLNIYKDWINDQLNLIKEQVESSNTSIIKINNTIEVLSNKYEKNNEKTYHDLLNQLIINHKLISEIIVNDHDNHKDVLDSLAIVRNQFSDNTNLLSRHIKIESNSIYEKLYNYFNSNLTSLSQNLNKTDIEIEQILSQVRSISILASNTENNVSQFHNQLDQFKETILNNISLTIKKIESSKNEFFHLNEILLDFKKNSEISTIGLQTTIQEEIKNNTIFFINSISENINKTIDHIESINDKVESNNTSIKNLHLDLKKTESDLRTSTLIQHQSLLSDNQGLLKKITKTILNLNNDYVLQLNSVTKTNNKIQHSIIEINKNWSASISTQNSVKILIEKVVSNQTKYDQLIKLVQTLNQNSVQQQNIIPLINDVRVLSSKTHNTASESELKINNLNQDLTQLIQFFSDDKLNLNSHFNSVKKELEITYSRIDALFSIHKLVDFKVPLPIMNEWAIASDFCHHMISKILMIETPVIFDVGSGISTIISGYIIKKKLKGKVIAIEHNKVYYEKTLKLIQQHELSEYIELYLCPLKKYNINQQTWKWYDIESIDLHTSIDLLCVDGPPGSIQHMARYPAIPILHKHLSEEAIILLDDTDRSDEKRIVKSWSEEFNLKNKFFKSMKGFVELNKS